MVLVVGATGLVGTEVCQKLARRGEKVRALIPETSSKEKIAALQSSNVELCVGDLKNPASLTAACRGVDAVISTAPLHSPGRRETRSSQSTQRDS